MRWLAEITLWAVMAVLLAIVLFTLILFLRGDPAWIRP
jgi:hypothetical protein